MKIKNGIMTGKEIDKIVSGIDGTWVKRRNAREKLVKRSNEIINIKLEHQRILIRSLKAKGAKESDLRGYYAAITKLELKKL